MNELKRIRFDLWPRTDTPADGPREIPYLDLAGEDDPIDFLFTLGGRYGLIARANLHTLQGTKKAGKSAAGLALIIAALKGEFIGLTPSRADLEILWIDTEQDRNTLRQKARAVLAVAGLDTMPDRVKIVALRGYGSPADLLAATLQAIADNAADLVFLDGVVDLCPAFNDEEKSRAVVRQLEAYAEQYGAAVLGLIHTNKHDNEARGHLGAVLQQKSAEIYQVNKDGNTAKVTQPFSRFAPVPDFSFTFADDFKIGPAGASADTDQWRYYFRQFEPLFHDTARLQSKDLVQLYMDYHLKGKRTAQEAVKSAVFFGALDKRKEGTSVFYSLPFAVEDTDTDTFTDGEPDGTADTDTSAQDTSTAGEDYPILFRPGAE
jgi:RecA-family ATPase